MRELTTQQQILSAAGKLLEAEGSAAVSMRRVAAAVRITPMAVYRHFEDRDSLLNALADNGFDDLSQRLDATRHSGNIDSSLRRVLNVNLDFALENPHLFQLMFLDLRKGARRFPRDFVKGKSPTGSRLAELVGKGIQEGVFRKVDVWGVVFETGALLQGLVMLYFGGRMDSTEQEFRRVCHRATGRYLDGIRR